MLNLADAVDRLGAAERPARRRSSRRCSAPSSTSRRCGRTSTGCFWDVRVATSTPGRAVRRAGDDHRHRHRPQRQPRSQGATVELRDRLGRGCTPTVAVTDATGKASVDLVGVRTERPVKLADAGILHRASARRWPRRARQPGRDRVRQGARSIPRSWRWSRATARPSCSPTSARTSRPPRSSQRPTGAPRRSPYTPRRDRARSCAASGACRCASGSGCATGCGRRSTT